MLENENEMKNAVGILRVSSGKQIIEGDSPDDQKIQITRKASVLNISEHEIKWFTFAESASGEIQPSQEAIDYCKDPSNHIKYFFIKDIYRFTRGGATIYGTLKAQLARYGVQLIDVMGIINPQEVNTLEHLGFKYRWSVFNPSYTTELLVAERGKDEVRDILTRMISAEIRYASNGYSVREAPPGFTNVKMDTPQGKRSVRTKHPVEGDWFIRMFELLAAGNLAKEEVADEINKLGYHSRIRNLRERKDKTKIIGQRGGIKLTPIQLMRYIQNPIYAGVVTEKWTGGLPVYRPEQALISIDLFNRANRGKITIFKDEASIKIVKTSIPNWRLVKKKDNPLYPFKPYVLCPIDRRPLHASATKGKGGSHFPAYHHGQGSKKDHYFRVPLREFNRTIETFVNSVKFSKEFTEKFNKLVLEEWQKREKSVTNDTITYAERIIQLDKETQLIKEKIKMLTSPITIQMFEGDIEKLQLEKAGLIQKRDQKEDEQLDVQTAINYAAYFMEHPGELILGDENHNQNPNFLGLLFEERPTYEDLVNGTPKLNCLFALSAHQEVSQKQLVRPA